MTAPRSPSHRRWRLCRRTVLPPVRSALSVTTAPGAGQAMGLTRRQLLGGFTALAGLVVFAPSAFAIPQAMDVRLGKPTPDVTRVVVDLSEDLRFSLFSLANPNRIIIDLPEIDWKLSREGLFGGGGIVKAMRYGLFQSGNSRMVLDLGSPALVKQSFILPPNEGGGWRLVIDLQATTQELFLAASGPEKRIGSFKPRPTAQDALSPQADAVPAKEGEPKQAALQQPNRDPATRNGEGGGGSGQKPDSKPDSKSDTKSGAKSAPRPGQKIVIVLDPGHGGVDPGAIGVSGVYEKNITLAAAKEFREILTASGRYEVKLTRDRDVFLPLRDRMALARKHGADLFVSIHADAVERPSVKGLSIYTLSEKASDAEAAALADGENKADIIAGIDLSRESAEVTNILIELAQRETMNLSSRIADTMIDELRREVRLLPRSHRFAGFAVLKAPDVPSILLEMGYLSNPEEEGLLRTTAYRAKLGKALLRAADRYFATAQKASRS